MFAKGVLMVLMISSGFVELSDQHDSSNGSVSVSNGELPLFTHGPMAMFWGNQFPSVRRRDVRSL